MHSQGNLEKYVKAKPLPASCLPRMNCFALFGGCFQVADQYRLYLFSKGLQGVGKRLRYPYCQINWNSIYWSGKPPQARSTGERIMSPLGPSLMDSWAAVISFIASIWIAVVAHSHPWKAIASSDVSFSLKNFHPCQDQLRRFLLLFGYLYYGISPSIRRHMFELIIIEVKLGCHQLS